MDKSMAMQIVNCVFALVGVISVLRFSGKWREVVDSEVAELKAFSKVTKEACCKRVRLSFAGGCKKIDELYGTMGVLAFVFVTLAIVFFVGALIFDNIGPASTATNSGNAPSQQNAQNNPPSQAVGGQTGQPTSTGNTPLAPQVKGTENFLLGVSSLMFVLIILGLVCIGNLTLIRSVLQASREFTW